VSDIFQFQTRINPSWLAVARLAPPFLRIDTPFPLMNLMARQKAVTAAIEHGVLVLAVMPGEPPAHWPIRQLDMVALLQRYTEAASLLEAIRTAEAPSPKPAHTRSQAGTSRKARAAGPSKTAPVVSIPMGAMLATARPEEVWEAIRARRGEPFTVAELQATLGASVGPYVMIWARDGYLTKADRDPASGSQWRYRLHRDQPTHPPVG
jgi:hypothetical protein